MAVSAQSSSPTQQFNQLAAQCPPLPAFMPLSVQQSNPTEQLNSTAMRRPRPLALMAVAAQRSEQLSSMALRDPAEWQGALPLPVPDMQHLQTVPRRPVEPLLFARKRMWNQSAPVTAGRVSCSKCRLEILGVLCWEGGKNVHFGCATDATREAVVAGTNTQDASFVPTLAAMFGAWRGASLLARGDIFKQFCFDCRFAPHLQHLELSRTFALSNQVLEKCFESAKDALFAEDPCVLRLYHGTSHAAAQEICATGFKLPTRAGMFGRGLYFSNVPDKSARYAPSGFVLVCDVALGRTKRLAHSMASLQEAPDGYDSVTALTREEGGTLRAPEYIVYNTSQVMPRYLLVLSV